MECDDEGLEQYLEEQKAKEAAEAGEKKDAAGDMEFDDRKCTMNDMPGGA